MSRARRDPADLAGGLILVAVGIAVAVWAGTRFDIGSARRMGPGFFPLGLGVILAGFGAVIAMNAAPRQGPQRLALPELGAVIAAIAIFALGLDRLGLVPTTAASVLVASAATPRAGLLWRLGLSAAVTGLAVAIFHGALALALPLFPT